MDRTEAPPPPETPAPRLQAVDLKKSFGSKVVLDGISFSVAPGESLVIVGPSGTGKSVLLKHLIGLVRPDSGKVFVAGAGVLGVSHGHRNSGAQRVCLWVH